VRSDAARQSARTSSWADSEKDVDCIAQIHDDQPMPMQCGLQHHDSSNASRSTGAGTTTDNQLVPTWMYFCAAARRDERGDCSRWPGLCFTQPVFAECSADRRHGADGPNRAMLADSYGGCEPRID
jgi:hypothetical protein